MNRRSFLQAGAAGLALSQYRDTALAYADGPPKRVGLIGSGWYGKCDLLRLIQVAPVEVVSICDVDRKMLDEAAGLIASEPLPGGRQAMALKVTEAGEAALDAWACDPHRAAGVGLDPFRLRSGVWLKLAPERRRAALDGVAEAIRTSIAAHERDLVAADPIERPRMLLALRLQRLRLDWIEETLKA